MQQHPLELASNWLAQARRDLDSARILARESRFEAACFASQQAAEKALKASLIALAGDRPRTHELGALIAELSRHRGDAIGALAEVSALDPYYASTRYPDAVSGGIPGEKFFAAEASTALERAGRAVAFVSRVLAALMPDDRAENG